MKTFIRFFVFASAALLIGCSTTQDITLAKKSYSQDIKTVSQVSADGNSPEMDANLETALLKQGFGLGPKLAPGATTSDRADALVSYVDVWRWDIAMYIKSLTVRLHDAKTGDLLALAQWADSPLHGFRDAKLVMDKLVADLTAKVRTASDPKK